MCGPNVRKLRVSRIHLLNRMTDELKLIQTLHVELAVSKCELASDQIARLLQLTKHRQLKGSQSPGPLRISERQG